MRTTTAKYKELIATNDTRIYLVRIGLTLADNTTLVLTNEDLWSGSFSIETASSGTSSFDLGSAIIGKCKFSLNNFDERFNQYDFFNATATVYVGLEGDLSNGNQVYVRMGFFTVDEPTFTGSLINLELLDNMWKFDVPVSQVPITYTSNTKASNVVTDICSYCGVPLNTRNFHGKDFPITEAPKNDMNCREYLQYIAMIGCNFCVIDSTGFFNIRWYDTASIPDEDSLDGGTFSTNTTPYSDGDTADGGNFTDYTSGDSYDGGTFTDNPTVDYFTRNYQTTIGTDEITITGVKIVIDQTEYTIGTAGYMLTIENPLINASNVTSALNLIWEVLENFKMRQFTVEGMPNLAVEVGDCCAVMDLKGNIIYTYVTNNTFTLSKQSAGLYAVSPNRMLTKRYSKTVQTAVEQARIQTDEIISDYDLAVQVMNAIAVNAIGGYENYEDLATGGRVWYLSNMPITKTGNVCTFETGSTVFKKTGDGFFVSTDGGQTWTNGYNAQTGQLVVNVLNAIGVSAEWVKTGTLTVGGNGTNPVILVRDSNNDPVCYINSNGLTMTAGRIEDSNGNWFIDATTGDMRLSGSTYVGSGSQTLDDYATKASTIVDVDVEYAKNQSSTTAPTTGWSTTSPQWQEGYFIWQRTKTTDGNSQVSYSTPVCIQGADGATGKGVSAIVEQYYLSTSDQTPTGGTWQNTQPTWEHGKYIWTRSEVTWTDSTVTTTTPVLAETANQANESVYQLDADLDQDGVFNRLIGGDTAQGIVLSNGKLYLRGEYLTAGAISIGGQAYSNNPTLLIKSSVYPYDTIGSWTKDGITANKGQFGNMLTIENNSLYIAGTRLIYENGVSCSKGFDTVLVINPTNLGITEDFTLRVRIDISSTYSYSSYGTISYWNSGGLTNTETINSQIWETTIYCYANTTEYVSFDINPNKRSAVSYASITVDTTLAKKTNITADYIASDFRGLFTGTAQLSDLNIDGVVYTTHSSSSGRVTGLRIKHNSNYSYASLKPLEIWLQDESNSTYLRFDADTSTPYIERNYSSTTEQVRWQSSSDERVKENIEPLAMELSKSLIDGSEPKSFKFIHKDGKHYGMIAQEARALLDKLGETDAQLEFSQGKLNVEDQRAIDYEEYIPHIINYLHYLEQKTDEQEERIRNLEKALKED